MPSAKCPNCKERLHIKADTEQGSIIACDDCESKLELVGLDPLELDPYEEKDADSYDEGFNVFDDGSGF